MQTSVKSQNTLIKYTALLVMAGLLSTLSTIQGEGPWIAVVSLATIVVAAPLRAIRVAFGALSFWGGAVALVIALTLAGLGPAALVVVTLATMVGVYSECEGRGASVFLSSVLANLAGLSCVGLTVGVWQFVFKADVGAMIREQLAPVVQSLSEAGRAGRLDVESMIAQVPSGISIALILLLALTLWCEPLFLRVFALQRVAFGPREKLRDFRVPDAFLWLAIAVVLGAFLKHGLKWLETLSINALNMLVVAYFFQGLAILSAAFVVFRVSSIWRSIWYILFVSQMFLVLSLIGFIDFWLDFRERLTRKAVREENRFG